MAIEKYNNKVLKEGDSAQQGVSGGDKGGGVVLEGIEAAD